MYFPSLIHLNEHGFDSEVIKQLDFWLSGLSEGKKRRIRPSRFAVDMGLSYDLANDIFSVSAVELGIFSINYEIYCPECEEFVYLVESIDLIPDQVRCTDCSSIFKPLEHEEFILLTFNLILTPRPDNTVTKERKRTYSAFDRLKPNSKSSEKLSSASFFNSNIGRKEIEKTFFQPNWEQYDVAYTRFLNSFDSAVSTEEKGESLEQLSCLMLSFINFFRVDSTVSTQTNQLDVTVTLRPYLSHIKVPLLEIMGRRIIGECKNEDKNVPSLWIDKVAGNLDKVDNCRIGIVFSRRDFSGDDIKYAYASQIEYARLGKYILSITAEDFKHIKEKRPNILYFLDDKLEELEMRIRKRQLPS